MKIGDLRRKYFAEKDCKWNGFVRYLSASIEKENEEVDEHEFLRLLIHNAAQAFEVWERKLL